MQGLRGSQTAFPEQLCTTLGHTEQRREAAASLCPPGLQDGLNIQDEDISSRGRRGAPTPPTAPAHPSGGAAAAGRPRAQPHVQRPTLDTKDIPLTSRRLLTAAERSSAQHTCSRTHTHTHAQIRTLSCSFYIHVFVLRIKNVLDICPLGGFKKRSEQY